MSSKVPQLPTISPEDLRRTFEAAVGNIGQPAPVIESSQSAPIVQRGQAIGLGWSKTGTEKRISDAARALAQLWKVSPHPAR